MIYSVILAAGVGKRMKTKEKKQFMLLNKKPVLYHSIDKFLLIKDISKLIIVVSDDDKNSKNIKRLINKYKKYILSEKIYIILGGKERYDSVYSALDFIDFYCKANDKDKVIIHDSARPNFAINDVKKIIGYLKKYKSITLASKLTDTIKEIKNTKIVKTLNRDNYALISTPQAFDYKLLYKCYNKFLKSKIKVKITDDIQLVELFSNTKSYILESTSLNYKITTQSDLNMLKCIMK